MNCSNCGTETVADQQYCRSCGTELTGGSVRSFNPQAWGLVMLMLMFSGLLIAMGGKLWTYLLPLAPPMALLTGIMLNRWLSGEADASTDEDVRHPEVPNALFILSCVYAAACLGAILYFDWHKLWTILPALSIPLAASWLRKLWPLGPSARGYGLAAIWLAWTFSWEWCSLMIDRMRQPSNPERQLERWRVVLGTEKPLVHTYGFNDQTIGYYARRESDRVTTEKEMRNILASPAHDELLLVDSREWNEFSHLPSASSFERIGEWSRWPKPIAYVLRSKTIMSVPTEAETLPASQPESAPATQKSLRP